MIYISHRGNTIGPCPEMENTMDYVQGAINSGFQVEIDVWSIGDFFFLGHDGPVQHVLSEWLESRADSLWFHCKNLQAFSRLRNHRAFLHDSEEMVSVKGYLWHHSTYTKFSNNSICVMPELVGLQHDRYINTAAGVCSDYIAAIKSWKTLKTSESSF